MRVITQNSKSSIASKPNCNYQMVYQSEDSPDDKVEHIHQILL